MLNRRRGGVVNREEIQEILRELMITLAVGNVKVIFCLLQALQMPQLNFFLVKNQLYFFALVRAPEPTVEPFTPEVSTGKKKKL